MCCFIRLCQYEELLFLMANQGFPYMQGLHAAPVVFITEQLRCDPVILELLNPVIEIAKRDGFLWKHAEWENPTFTQSKKKREARSNSPGAGKSTQKYGVYINIIYIYYYIICIGISCGIIISKLLETSPKQSESLRPPGRGAPRCCASLGQLPTKS